MPRPYADWAMLKELFLQQDKIQRGLAPVSTVCYTRVGDKRTIVGKMARGGRYRVVDEHGEPALPLRYPECWLMRRGFGGYIPFF